MKFNKNEFGWSTKNESSSSSGGGLTTAQENKLNIAYNHSKEEHFSGDYNDLTNKPTNISEFNNDANYASETYVNDKIDEAQLGGDSGTIDLSGYVTKERGNANQITFADGQTFQAKLDNGTLKGEKGDKGDKGADGLTTSISLNGVTYTQENGVITLPNITSGGNIQPITQIEPQELDMPKVFFYGTALPTTKDNVNLTMDYISNTDKFTSFVKLKCQGTSSMSYAKKNFTVAMYSDEARATKLKKDFKGWGAQSKFCLKANYVDTTHTRNISGARIAYDMVASRPNSAFKQQLLTAPRYGVVDGFPIKLYFNGEFYGIYTWNIPKDGWMFNMDEGNTNHMVLCAEKNNDSTNISDDILRCEFRKEWDGTDGNSWSIEFGTYSDTLKNSFNRCVNFVMTATDEEFKANIGNYFDLYSLLDYYCFSYLVAHIDGLAKNMLMATYDGVIWGATLYDMDSIYGADWQGTQFKATNIQCPEQYQDTNSLLWQRIEQCFTTELYARYLELRKEALSLSNIIKHVEEIYDVIPDRVFADEKAKWTSLPGVNTNTMTRFRNYMRDRAVYVDAQMLEIGTKIPCTGIVLSADTLSFTTTDTQTLSVVVSPDNCTDAVTWSVSPSGIVTVDNGVVTPVANGTCTITATCGSYSDTCSVNVTLANVACTGITLDQDTLTIDASTSTTAQLTATVTPTNCTQPVVWSVSPEGIVTVDNGVVTAVTNGQATVTATCGTQSATCTVTVSGIESNYLANASWQVGTIDVDTPGMSTSTADMYTTVQIPAGKYALTSSNATWKKCRLNDSKGKTVYSFKGANSTEDCIIDTSLSDDTTFTLEVCYYKPNDTIETPSLITTTETNLTILTLDGSLSYAIPNWDGNPSGQNGQINVEYCISGLTKLPTFRNIKGYTFNDKLTSSEAKGLAKQYRISLWNGTAYLAFTLDMAETGVTNDVESITNYLSNNPLTFKYVM